MSRVGGAAQTKAMKKAAGSLRIDLAQYREMEVFTQFSSDLDEATTQQLKQGKVLMELLKQPLEHPLSHAEEVVVLTAGESRKFIDVPVKQVKEYENAFLSWMEEAHRDIMEEIDRTGRLEDGLKERILKAADEFAAEKGSHVSNT